MRSLLSRAGLMLGALAMTCACAAHADDLRSREVLVESGVFLAHAETNAAFARLDADRSSAATSPVPKPIAYWESGAASFGQGERDGRIGSGGSTTQMRLGVDREVQQGVVLGAMGAMGFGDVNSGDVGADVVGTHADLYARFDEGPILAKALIGGSMFDYASIARGQGDEQCRGASASLLGRAAAQFGGRIKAHGVTFSPTVGVAAYWNTLDGYAERGGAAPLSFSDRRATAAIGSFQLRGTKSFKVAPTRKVDLEGYVGVDETLAYAASALKATDVAGKRVATTHVGAPNGRGAFGGVGVGTALSQGVDLRLTYDYGLRDHVSTHASRARLSVSF